MNTPTISSTEGQEQEDVCPICGGLGYVREDVPVDHPRFGRLFPCACRLAEIEQQRLRQLRALSNLAHLDHMTFDTFLPHGRAITPEHGDSLPLAYEETRRYAEDPRGWLILLGAYGCGKTHLAAAIANRAIERGQPVLFVVVPDLLDYLRATYSPTSPVRYDERFDQVRNAPLLVLDDLGTQSSTPWVREKLFQILNHRYNTRLPTVITSNQRIEEIDVRIRSRMLDPGVAKIVAIDASDFRQVGALQEQSELSSLSLLADMTFQSFDLRPDLPAEERANLKETLEICRNYADHPQDWLVLQGVYGCGKTHLAAAIANEQVRRGEPVLFVVVPDLLDHLRATYSPDSPVRFDQRFEEVRRAPLLVLDDLGTQSASPWAQEKLYQLFNHRYNARLPTVITTSLSIDKADPRLRTRMLDVARCKLWLIEAPSYRGTPQRRAERAGRPRGQRGR